MFQWLSIIILAYLLFAFGSFFDKLVLKGKPNPVSYTFYVGLFSLLVVLIIPFVQFQVPESRVFVWIILDALVYTAGLYFMFSALERFDVSRVVPIVGAFQPIFIFLLAWLFWGFQQTSGVHIAAFLLLLLGSIIISLEKRPELTIGFLGLTISSALMFSLDYTFAKFVFLSQPFLQGFIWIRMFVFVFALFLLLNKRNRGEIFAKKTVLNPKTQIYFFSAQAFGGVANFLQSFAIFLAPVGFLATVNSLRGVQYVFLFLITLFVSLFLPKVLKEKFSKKLLFQKVVSIGLIVVGLALLIV